MYEINFPAATQAGWRGAIEGIDETTNQPFADLQTYRIELQVQDRSGHAVLSANSDWGGGIEFTSPSTFRWDFGRDRMAALEDGTTYNVGCTATNAERTVQLFIGTLPFIDGFVT